MSTGNKKQSATTIAQLMELSSSETANVKIMNDETPDNLDLDTSYDLDNSPKVAESADAGVFSEDSKTISILDKLLANNMLVPGSGLDRRIQDDYRRVKRPLISNVRGRNKSMVERGNLILVTSSIPGEGKTYTSVNLALSISQEMDTTVLLVDCDVAKQGVSRMLGLENVCGLVDVLESDGLSIGDVLLKTDIPNFRVLSAGKQNEYYTELLASHRMSDLVNELASRYSDRIIIFDGPPLLSTPQTQVLAGLVGQVVFVVEAGKTSQSLVEEALDMVPEEQATGLLLNKNQGLSRHGHSYYGYGYYGSEENKSEDAT